MAEKFVIVHRSYDPILIEHLGEMLRESGIAARVLGTRDAAGIGVGQSIAELHLSVPHPQAGDAVDFLEDFFAEEGSELLQREGLYDDDDEYDDDDDAESVGRSGERLSHSLAGIVVLFCGLGHVYARRRVTGLALTAGFIVIAFGGPFALWKLEVDTGVAIGIALFALMLCDFIGAQIAVRAHNQGIRRGAAFQLGMAAVYGVIVLLASQIPQLARPLDDAFPSKWQLRSIQRQLERPVEPSGTIAPFIDYGFDFDHVPLPR